MNAAHYHLIINHIPVLATFFSIGILSWGLLANNKAIKKVALVGFLVAGISVLAAYQSGESAEDIVEEIPAVTHDSIEEHEEAADLSRWMTLALGLGAVGGMYLLTKSTQNVTTYLWILLAYSLFTAASLAYTANLGGMIRHTEIVDTESTATVPAVNEHDDNGDL